MLQYVYFRLGEYSRVIYRLSISQEGIAMADPERSKFLLEFYGPAVTTIIEVLYTCALYMVNVCVHVHGIHGHVPCV